MKNEKELTLAEFQRAVGLSDGAIGYLLVRNLLPITVDREKGVVVDTTSIRESQLIQALTRIQEPTLGEREDLYGERLCAVIAQFFDDVLREAGAHVELSEIAGIDPNRPVVTHNRRSDDG